GVRIPWTTTKLFELRGPHRGEVIVFIYPCDPDRDYIKRVVALPGQTVEVRCNIVYVDGVAVPSVLKDPDCKYEDYDERRDSWFERSCSRYEEAVDDKLYSTYHDADRPVRDARMLAGTLAEGDGRDFPAHNENQMPPICSNAKDDVAP